VTRPTLLPPGPAIYSASSRFLSLLRPSQHRTNSVREQSIALLLRFLLLVGARKPHRLRWLEVLLEMRGDHHMRQRVNRINVRSQKMIVDRPNLLPATKIRRDKRRIGRQILDQLQHIPRRQIRIVRQDVTKVDAIKPAEVSNKLAAMPINYFCEPEAPPT